MKFDIAGRRATWAAFLASAIVGCAFGSTQMATWQTAVESAQVLAGVVCYAPDNSFYQYHIGAWTLSHQVLAVPLWLGVSEQALSVAVSGVLGALSFVSLSLCAFAFSRSPFVALFAPLFAMAVFLGREQYGVVYPIQMMGTHHTYGVLGRSGALAFVSLYALGWRRTAVFGALTLVALHPTWGAWTVLLLGVAVAVECRRDWRSARAYATPTFFGLAVCVVSYLIQAAYRRHLPEVDPNEVDDLLAAFVAHWDYHRKAVALTHPGTLLAGATALLAWLACRKASGTSRTMARLLLVSSGFAALGGIASHLPEYLPGLVNRVMPGRFVNLGIFALPAVLAGLTGGALSGRTRSAGMALLGAYACANGLHHLFLSSDKYGWSLPHAQALLAFAVLLAVAMHFFAPKAPPVAFDFTRRGVRAVGVTLVATLIALIAFADKPRSFAPGRDEEIWRVTRSLGTLLITSGDQHVVQVRARCPVLVNVGALDQAMQVPQSAPALARDLRDVYGIDLRNPPDDIRAHRPGALLPNSARELFALRRRYEWTALAEQYGATHVLADAGWRLDLEAVVRSEGYVLYALPAP